MARDTEATRQAGFGHRPGGLVVVVATLAGCAVPVQAPYTAAPPSCGAPWPAPPDFMASHVPAGRDTSVRIDPVVDIAGAFFPGWLAAVLIGAGLTAAIRYLFVVTRLEPHLGPPALIYASLGLLLITASWLVLYRS